MDEIDVVQFVQGVLRERRSLVLDVLANKGVNSMEQNQELSDMLERQESLDG